MSKKSKSVIESDVSDVLAESFIADGTEELVTVTDDMFVRSDDAVVVTDTFEQVEVLDDVKILPADVPVVVVDSVPKISDEPMFYGEVSDRVMWLRDKFGLTPGKEFDVKLLSTIKSWQRENDFMPSGVFPVGEWNVLFNLV